MGISCKRLPRQIYFEAAIPFKSIRYKKGITAWGINFSRNDLKSAEKSAWAPVPRQFPAASLAYTGTLVWDRSAARSGIQIFPIIPYGLTSISKDYTDNKPVTVKASAGVDAKIAVSSALNLDLR